MLRTLVASALIATAFASTSHAYPSDLEERVRTLERDNQRLERLVGSLQYRVDRLDGGARPNPGPGPTGQIACLIVESGFKKTYFATASTRLDAELAVQRICESDTVSSNCRPGSGAVLKCDSETDPWTRGWVCLVEDSSFHKTYRGEGTTPVEAEAKAKISCQGDTFSSNCGTVSARCEAIR